MTLSGIGGLACSERLAALSGGSGDEIVSLTVDRKPHGFTGAVMVIVGVLKSISVDLDGPTPMELTNIGATLN